MALQKQLTFANGSSADIGGDAIAALNGTDIAYISAYDDSLCTYRYAFSLSKPWRYPFTS